MTKVTYIDNTGTEVSEFPFGMEYLAIAKKVIGEELVRFYIYRADGRLLDPKLLNARQLKKARKQLVSVSEDIYNLYVRSVRGISKTPVSSIERLI